MLRQSVLFKSWAKFYSQSSQNHKIRTLIIFAFLKHLTLDLATYYIHKMGETKKQQEEITNKLFDAILDLKSSLKKPGKCRADPQ